MLIAIIVAGLGVVLLAIGLNNLFGYYRDNLGYMDLFAVVFGVILIASPFVLMLCNIDDVVVTGRVEEVWNDDGTWKAYADGKILILPDEVRPWSIPENREVEFNCQREPKDIFSEEYTYFVNSWRTT